MIQNSVYHYNHHQLVMLIASSAHGTLAHNPYSFLAGLLDCTRCPYIVNVCKSLLVFKLYENDTS